MKKWYVIPILFLTLLFISACSIERDNLAGKIFNIAYTPVLEEDISDPNNYDSIMAIKFLNENAVINTIDDTKGVYELHENMIIINFENENEKLKIEFTDFRESERDFSSFSTLINNIELEIKDPEKILKLKELAYKLSEKLPVEFIEK